MMIYLIISMLFVAISAGLVILRASKFLFTELNESWLWYHSPVYNQITVEHVPVETFHTEVFYTSKATDPIYLYSPEVKFVTSDEKKQYLITQKASEIGRQLLKDGFFKIREYNSINTPYYNTMIFTHPDINVISIELKCIKPKEETNPFGDD